MNRIVKRLFLMMGATTIIAGSVGSAFATSSAPNSWGSNLQGMTQFYGNIDFKTPGNALLAPADSAYNQTPDPRNDYYPMYNVDKDGDSSTQASSMAKLNIPANAEILYAHIGIVTSHGEIDNSKDKGLNSDGSLNIKFKKEGGSYVSARAPRVGYSLWHIPASYGGGVGYNKFEYNVTNYIKQNKGGNYWVALPKQPAPFPYKNQTAGWNLTVVYKDPSIKKQNTIKIYKGIQIIERDGALNSRLYGVGYKGKLVAKASSGNDNSVDIAFVAYEGDKNTKNGTYQAGSVDKMIIKNYQSGNWERIGNTDDLFISTVDGYSQNNPNRRSTGGLDIRRYNIQSSGASKYVSSQNTLELQVMSNYDHLELSEIIIKSRDTTNEVSKTFTLTETKEVARNNCPVGQQPVGTVTITRTVTGNGTASNADLTEAEAQALFAAKQDAATKMAAARADASVQNEANTNGQCEDIIKTATSTKSGEEQYTKNDCLSGQVASTETISHSETREGKDKSMEVAQQLADTAAQSALDAWFTANGQNEANKQGTCTATAEATDTRTFAKDDCAEHFVGEETTLTFTGTGSATNNDPQVAQDEAEQIAQANLEAQFTDNGQTKINEEGKCLAKDTPGDGVPDFVNCPGMTDSHLAIDKDKDGIKDAVEVLAGEKGALASIPGELDDWFDWDEKHQVATLKIQPSDFDGDGTWDMCDTDSDNDGILDEWERKQQATDEAFTDVPVDTDSDNSPDFRDLDADNDGILDSYERKQKATEEDVTLVPVDTDEDGKEDFRDLDADGDKIPDTVERKLESTDEDITEQPIDFDDDGMEDFRDLDTDSDGIPDSYEAVPDGVTADGLVNNPVDTDGDKTGDWRDLDSDGDKIPDDFERKPTGSDEEISENPVDTDGDGKTDFRDLDSDNDTIEDEYERKFPNDPDVITDNPVDKDGDGEKDFRDTDTDGDGIPDIIEGKLPDGSIADIDGDGFEDFRDLDTDSDGIPDEVERGPDGWNPYDTDSDGTWDFRDRDSDDDGKIDFVEKGPNGWKPMDTDENGLPDYRQVDKPEVKELPKTGA